MADKKMTDTVFNMAAPIAQENNCFVDDVEFKKEGADYVLRVILDVPDDQNGGVSIDQCEAVSRALSDQLDTKDPIERAYMLEVTSPGMDRPLKRDKDFERFMGREIEIGLYKAVNGSKAFSGTLTGYADGIITIENDGVKTEFDKKTAAYVRLAVIW